MIPEITLISDVNFNWSSGQLSLHSVDASKVKFSEAAKVLVACGENGGDPLITLRYLPKAYMKFLHYTFWIKCDEDSAILFKFHSDLTVVIKDNGVLATGTLDLWHDAIVRNLTTERPFNFRVLIDKLLLTFEYLGLGELWYNYRKKSLKDQTFLLEYTPIK